MKTKGNIPGAILIMALLSILLCWLPFIGSLIAGIVGGKKAGSVGNAFVAVLLPGIIFGIILFFLAGSISSMPIIGAIAGAGGFILALAGVGPLLLGAVIGGAVA